MLNSADLYLGAFLILCGFALSLLNLRRLVKESSASFPSVLVSENILLMCIGIAFVSKSVHELDPANVKMYDIEERTAMMNSTGVKISMDCNFSTVLISYGPLIISLVNSFLSLIIDNYMHYRMLADTKKNDDENTVQEISQEFRSNTGAHVTRLFTFGKKYFSYIAIAFQWIIPVLLALSMYPVDIKQRSLSDLRSLDDSCMAMVDVIKENCSFTNDSEYFLELRNYIPSGNYLEVYETEPNNSNVTKEINSVVNNVYKIMTELRNESISSVTITSAPLFRQPKSNGKCMKVCYLDNKNLILYMFILAIVSYFVPITISTIILTKIHVMDIKRPNVKTYVSRELLYNILFWTPVMFDTFLSLVLCAYSMNGIRTSIFNVIANVYQAVKNFMNTKYFKDNAISPI